MFEDSKHTRDEKNAFKQDEFSRKASFSSNVQQYNRKQLNQIILCPFDARRLAGGKGHQNLLYDDKFYCQPTAYFKKSKKKKKN